MNGSSLEVFVLMSDATHDRIPPQDSPITSVCGVESSEMLEKKGVSPLQCQSGGASGVSGGGGGGPASGATTAVNDTNNGLETKRCSGSKGSTSVSSNSASSSGPNTPSDPMMAPLTATQDFVIIKSEDQMPPSVAANHCDSKSKLNVETQLRSNHMIDTKPNMNTLNASVNTCGNRDNAGMKCRDNIMSCGANGVLNGPLNGPLNGMNCMDNTSPHNLLNDDKLTSFPNEFGIRVPVPTGGNLSVPGDLPPFPLMSQPMNSRMRPRGPCGPPPAQGLRMPMNALHSQPHNNLHQMVANNQNMAPNQKSSMTMESQYMQQQSQIFVFNTQLANDAAEAVDNGSFPSIIEYHCGNPDTKRLLEKFPLKAPLNRNNCSPVWLNNMSQVKQGGRGLKPNMSTAQPMHPSLMKNSFGQPREAHPVSCAGPCNMQNSSGVTSGPGPGGGLPNNWSNNMNPMCSNPNASPNWSAPQQPMFAQNSEMNSNNVFTNSPVGANGPNGRGCVPFGANNFPPNPQMFNNSPNPGMGGPPQQSEIPDESLTLEQRQNREKKLALIRSMQQQLCPEMMEPSPMGHMIRMPAPNQPMNAPDFMNDPNNMYAMSESDPMANTDPHMNNMTPSRMIANPNNNTQTLSSMPPTSGTTSLEWQKANFMDDRRRKPPASGQGVHNTNNNSVPISHQSPLSQPSSTLNSPNPCISQSPGSRIPPPPYNQGIRSHSSPHPASPVTGSLPLSSPRMQSPVDGSGQQFTSGGQSRVSHTSPGPATPSADSNSSMSGAGVHWKQMTVSSAQNTIPSTTSSSAVKNSGRSQASTNAPNIRANTPSSIAPSSSPSSVKKLPNLMTQSQRAMGPDCSDLLINSMPNSGVDPNRPHHPNDVPLMGPTVATNCSSPFICNKPEAALMPVPSPQQIQYLNTFEGQELTIQKQPNTSLRDTDLISHASDLDIGFNNEFTNSCQPFASNERLPNFPIMDGMNPRFASNPQNMSGNQFDLNPRFMTADNNQRFGGQVFDGQTPRMLNSHESQFRPQNMLCMPYGQMDNNLMRFNSPCDNIMPPRVRGPSDMVSNRFAHHSNDNMQSPQHFNPSMSGMNSSEQMNLMPFPGNQSSGAQCMSAVNSFNTQMESGFSSSPLQNLQKMTPPYDIGPPSKVDRMISNGALTHSHNPNGSMSSVSQTQRTNNFDPISSIQSMAAMGEPNVNNPMNGPNIMTGPSMNMSSIQMAANGPPPGPPNMVNFHTTMSSMQGIQQNMSGETINGGIQGQYPMGQMNPNMTGGPQTVNNTYVNATMSIQQLNIQNLPNHNFNPNLDPPPNMNVPQNLPISGGPPPGPPMQMMPTNTSTKMGSNFGPRMGGPTSGPNFAGQQMNANPRGMNPMAFQQQNPQMMRCSYNSPNIQIKPDAPNTIQYLPPRQQNPNVGVGPGGPGGGGNRPPSLMFLQRCEPPLTNLGNKLPTHNLQYFPNNSANNMNFTRPPNMNNMNMYN